MSTPSTSNIHGRIFCGTVLAALAVTGIATIGAGGLIFALLLSVVPGAAYILFATTRARFVRWICWCSVIPFCPLATYYLLIAPVEAASDAQGALIYLFAPIVVLFVSVLVGIISSVVGLVCWLLYVSLRPTKKNTLPSGQ